MRTHRRLLIAMALACGIPALHAQTTNYPEKAVRVIVPFAPGGPADVLARLVGEALGKDLKQAFVIDNKAGAAGNIGVGQIAKANPDGYTLGVVPNGNLVVNPSLYPSLPYKVNELQPVAMLGEVENILVVGSGVSANSLQELLALARSKPNSLSFATPGAGSQAHMAAELMAQQAGIQISHVPYKGMGPAMSDVLSGHVSMLFGSASSVLPFIQNGKLRAIGVASPKRSATLPNVPTIAEQGLPGFEAISWYALLAPAGTPKAVVDKLSNEVNAVMKRPETQQKVSAQGISVATYTPEQLSARMKAETTRWASVIKSRNLTMD